MRTAGFILLAFLIPALSFAADLVNINTADASLLDTLPGVGPTIAGRIIDYRTAHGPFAAIADIQNVSGIGPSTYAKLEPYITVGDGAAPAAAFGATSTPAAPVQSGGAATYVPPPSSLSLEIDGESSAYVNVPLFLIAQATAKGSVDRSAQIAWSFGDGSYGTGIETDKIYRYSGTYLVTATASDGGTKAHAELTVTVTPAQVRISAVSGEGITLANDAQERLDLSGWHLVSDVGFFRIPEGTVMLPKASVLFPFSVTNLPVSFSPALAYPDGTLAASWQAPEPAQPPAPESGSPLVQNAPEPVAAPAQAISVSGTAHDTTTGLAPAAATELAAAGAALKAAPSAPVVGKPLVSPWTLGLLGVIVLAGGAFILL